MASAQFFCNVHLRMPGTFRMLFTHCSDKVSRFILLHEKLLQFDWLRAVVFQLNLKYLHVKITNLAGSSINK